MADKLSQAQRATSGINSCNNPRPDWPQNCDNVRLWVGWDLTSGSWLPHSLVASQSHAEETHADKCRLDSRLRVLSSDWIVPDSAGLLYTEASWKDESPTCRSKSGVRWAPRTLPGIWLVPQWLHMPYEATEWRIYWKSLFWNGQSGLVSDDVMAFVVKGNVIWYRATCKSGEENWLFGVDRIFTAEPLHSRAVKTEAAHPARLLSSRKCDLKRISDVFSPSSRWRDCRGVKEA